jgi:hypothetical protein
MAPQMLATDEPQQRRTAARWHCFVCDCERAHGTAPAVAATEARTFGAPDPLASAVPRPHESESAIKHMSRAGWRRKEPGDRGPPEHPRLLRRAVEALREKAGVTIEDLAAEAHLSVDLVEGYLRPGVPARVTVEL